MRKYELIAPCHFGLEAVLKKEIIDLGYDVLLVEDGRVTFLGDEEAVCRANIGLRTAERILVKVGTFHAETFDELFENTKALPWEEYIPADGRFWVAKAASVKSRLFSPSDIQSIMKKAMVERLKNVYHINWFKEDGANYPVRVFLMKDEVTVGLDTTGDSLHKRGYRKFTAKAPIAENLAAAMIMLTPWREDRILVDPFCGSGTIPIEAALIARNIAPGVFRKGFAFEKWVDFDSEMFDEIYNDDSQEREFTHKIYGYDNSPKANEIATHNIKAAGVSKDVTLKLQPFQQFEQPQEKSIIVMNPPYGERISTNDLLGLYQMIGERLKHAFVGNEAWVLSYREECFDQIGLKPSKKVPLFNGALECEFRKYEIFDGKYKEFKSQEGEGEEKKETEGGYDTPRPRERKEFKPRREGEYKPRREGEFKPRKEGDFKPRREEGSFTRDDRDRKPRGEFRGERDSRAPREFRGNREPRIPKKEEE